MENPLAEELQQERRNTTPTIGLGLVSDVSCLQNALLIDQLQTQLNTQCRLIAPERAKECRCLLLDCNTLPPERIQELLQQLAGCQPMPPVALLNATPYGPHESLINWTGLNGIFYHSTDHHQLILGIKQIISGDFWLPRRLLCHFLERNRRSPGGRNPGVHLTRRETQILNCIQQGATNAEISCQLFVSEHTIKSHLYNIFKKIGVKNRLEASNWAREYL